jgi:hypothetical protein
VPVGGEPNMSETPRSEANPASRTKMWRPIVLAANSLRSIQATNAAGD